MEKTIGINEIQKIETLMLEELNEICKRNKIKYFIAYGTLLGAIRHSGPIPWDNDADVFVRLSDLERLITCLRQELSEHFSVDYYDVNPDYGHLFPRIGLKNSCSEVVHVDLFPITGLPKCEIEQRRFIKKSNYIQLFFMFRSLRVSAIKSFKKPVAYVIRTLVSVIPKDVYFRTIEGLWKRYTVDNCNYVFSPYGYKNRKVFKKDMFENELLVDYCHLELPAFVEYDAYLTLCYGDYLKVPEKAERERGLQITTKISSQDYDKIFKKRKFKCAQTF